MMSVWEEEKGSLTSTNQKQMYRRYLLQYFPEMAKSFQNTFSMAKSFY